MRRATSTLLFVAGYWLMACLDPGIAVLPAVGSFAAGSALIVRPALL